jgi:DNA-binding MurR/RpiR family transcriptional regulator
LNYKASVSGVTVAERIRSVRNQLTPAELAVANRLLASYPMAGLVPIVQLAADANVSAPTVTRLISKLGFSGYGAFHETLRAEIQARIFSPVDVYPRGASAGEAGSASARANAAYLDSINSTFLNLNPRDLDAAVAALADSNRPTRVHGGRYSSVLSSHLVAYLSMLRPGVVQVAPNSGARIAGIVDVGPQTVVVVYDFRRYQQTTIEWGLAAAARGAHLIVVTDQFLSPLAPHATSLLTTSTNGLGPFDSMTGGFALTELLISEVARTLGEPARERLAEIERLQMREEQLRHSPISDSGEPAAPKEALPRKTPSQIKHKPLRA